MPPCKAMHPFTPAAIAGAQPCPCIVPSSSWALGRSNQRGKPLKTLPPDPPFWSMMLRLIQPKMPEDWEPAMVKSAMSGPGLAWRARAAWAQAGITPGTVTRSLGPWGPNLVHRYIHGRFRYSAAAVAARGCSSYSRRQRRAREREREREREGGGGGGRERQRVGRGRERERRGGGRGREREREGGGRGREREKREREEREREREGDKDRGRDRERRVFILLSRPPQLL